LNETAIVDVPLGNDAVEWRYDALICLFLAENPDLRLLGGNVGLGNADRRLLRG
jgi:hypothetical protein